MPHPTAQGAPNTLNPTIINARQVSANLLCVATLPLQVSVRTSRHQRFPPPFRPLAPHFPYSSISRVARTASCGSSVSFVAHNAAPSPGPRFRRRAIHASPRAAEASRLQVKADQVLAKPCHSVQADHAFPAPSRRCACALPLLALQQACLQKGDQPATQCCISHLLLRLKLQ